MRRWLVPVLGVLAAACADSPPTEPGGGAAFNEVATTATGNVYTATNAASGNEVVAFDRAADGSLTAAGTYATGGDGTGGGLGNQGGVVLSQDGNWLLVVNAGSNDVSVFARAADGTLSLTDREPSGGMRPISITIRGQLVFVLNAGGDGNISGFFLKTSGDLEARPGSTQPLSQAGGTDPAQVQFANNGNAVVVTEKMTNRIVVYPLLPGKKPMPGVVNSSAGPTPFGFGVDPSGRLVVSEAAGGAAGAGVVSSYAVRPDGTIEVLAGAVPDFQSAPCWIVITGDGRFAYTTNTASNNISGYRIRPNGTLELLDSDGITATSDAGPIDAALSYSSAFLYVLNGSGASVTAYSVGADGSLTPIAGGATVPGGSNGLAAY